VTKKISTLLSAQLINEDCFCSAVEIVRNNCQGQFWLIGGMVYRTLASMLYGAAKPEIDLDFIVSRPNKKFDLPDGWRVERNRFGTDKLVSLNGLKIDFVPLEDVFSIKARNLEPTIDNFLTGVPLDIQSIAFDVENEVVIGNLGFSALLTKMVRVVSLPLLKFAAKNKEMTPKKYAQNIADSLEFGLLLPKELVDD
jgi:hypothetical protein